MLSSSIRIENRKVVNRHLFTLLGRVWSLRIARFGVVAGICTALQELVLVLLMHFDVQGSSANAIGFAISAQINFCLSSLLIWSDRQLQWHLRTALARLCKFNAAASLALVANTSVFALVVYLGTAAVPASLSGVIVGAGISFGINHLVTYRSQTKEIVVAMIETENRPHSASVRTRAQQEGVAFFLPAYNEAENLRVVVPRIVKYFDDLDCSFTVIIVDDGSVDETHSVAEQLASEYSGAICVVRHVHNKGYGAALQTGIRRALETGHGLIAFCDADGQFEIESFGTLLAALNAQQAGLAVGYRIARADSFKRRLMGRGWHWLSSSVLGFKTARDVDCGFKLFTRAMLENVAPQLRGEYAAVSPEIIARAVRAGFNLVEAGLNHKSRLHGEQTGADLKVVLSSLVQLFQLRLALRKEG